MADETVLSSSQIQRFLCFGDVKYPLIRTYEKIGRDEKSNVHLKNLEISVNHAKIKVNNNNVFIQDLNSKNGTRIDGNVLTPYHYYQIKNNNIITFGNCLEGKFIEVEADTNNNSSASNNNIKEINENSKQSLNIFNVNESVRGDNLEESINEPKISVKKENKSTVRFSGYYLRSKDKNKTF